MAEVYNNQKVKRDSVGYVILLIVALLLGFTPWIVAVFAVYGAGWAYVRTHSDIDSNRYLKAGRWIALIVMVAMLVALGVSVANASASTKLAQVYSKASVSQKTKNLMHYKKVHMRLCVRAKCKVHTVQRVHPGPKFIRQLKRHLQNGGTRARSASFEGYHLSSLYGYVQANAVSGAVYAFKRGGQYGAIWDQTIPDGPRNEFGGGQDEVQLSGDQTRVIPGNGLSICTMDTNVVGSDDWGGMVEITTRCLDGESENLFFSFDNGLILNWVGLLPDLWDTNLD